ncbi:hypothetical protein J31TS6_56830 [Brevibacillus reuszeri]|nr:hypothetical protein J31TS6_56830 [Brevibacillus reuszeri]
MIMSSNYHPKQIASERVEEPPTIIVHPTKQTAESFSNARLATGKK